MGDAILNKIIGRYAKSKINEIERKTNKILLTTQPTQNKHVHQS